jgi:hypothetical protein
MHQRQTWLFSAAYRSCSSMAGHARPTKAYSGLKALVIGLTLFAAATSSARCAESAGTVKTASGAVTVVRGAGTPLAIAVGQRVFAGDRILTSMDGYAGITMHDDTRFTIGPNSEFLIRDFDFDPNTHRGNIGVSFLKGMVIVVSGLISKQSSNRVDLRTLSSTIGIRGTEFIVDVGVGDDTAQATLKPVGLVVR